MYPSKAHIYLSLFNDDDFYNNRVSFWRNIYGIDFTPIVYVEPNILDFY
jgi:hypothetical protein